jgi:CDK inhibitor PHO81
VRVVVGSDAGCSRPADPVLFGALCGAPRAPSAASAAAGGVDRRAATIAAAVELAKANNVLGVLLDAELLAQVPSVVQGIKRAGLLVAAFGAGAPDVDAVLRDGVLVCVEQGLRTFI